MMISPIWTMFLIVPMTLTLTVTLTVLVSVPLPLTMTVNMTMTVTMTVTLSMTLSALVTVTPTMSAIRRCIAEVCFQSEQPGSEERESLDHHSPRDMHPSIPV
jgi:hypothetical protein